MLPKMVVILETNKHKQVNQEDPLCHGCNECKIKNCLFLFSLIAGMPGSLSFRSLQAGEGLLISNPGL